MRPQFPKFDYFWDLDLACLYYACNQHDHIITSTTNTPCCGMMTAKTPTATSSLWPWTTVAAPITASPDADGPVTQWSISTMSSLALILAPIAMGAKPHTASHPRRQTNHQLQAETHTPSTCHTTTPHCSVAHTDRHQSNYSHPEEKA